MAITASGLYVDTWIKIVKNDLEIDLVSDTIKCALFVSHSSWSPNFSALAPGYGIAPYTNTLNYEIPGTGGYTSGGKDLTGKIVEESPAGVLRWGANDIVWTASTISNASGALFYDDTLAGNPAILFMHFGTPYSTQSGDFKISCPSTGFMALDLTP